MYIIKLDAIDSTNAYLKDLTTHSLPKDYTVVVAEQQTHGRGQMGTKWQSESGKNLTVSVFKKIRNLQIQDQFYVSMAVSLAICAALNKFQIPQLRIKWPNDILSADKKICGILIENVIKQNELLGTIIGFGLNVNQRYFNRLPQASSMYVLTGILNDKEEVLSEILKQLVTHLDRLGDKSLADIKDNYEDVLFRKDKASTFTTNGSETFTGIITGVTGSGQLKVLVEDDRIKTFDFKQVQLMY
jgi:BirA family biotin operon repressor/biotin-[acetyl-CoA-carboxylase] ligase